MSTLNVATGVSTVGNSGNTDVALTNLDAGIKSFKTLIDGQWKSWSKGAPESFQGFVQLGKGLGYVVNSDTDAVIDISDEEVNINDVDIADGLNFICFPYDNKTILDGLLPRVHATTIKTIIGSWKSYSVGAPDSFQGFLSVDKDKGYVLNVDKKYGAYLSNDVRDSSNGARIGTSYMNTIGGDSSSPSDMVEFVADSNFSSIDYTPVPYDDTQPLLEMWVAINGSVKLLKFPAELTGKTFSIKETLLDITTYGLITESSTETVDYGSIMEASSEVLDYGDLTGGHLQTNTMYMNTFNSPVGNSESNPVTLDTDISLESIELLFDVKTVAAESNDNKMLIIVDGVKSILEFADEYIGESFVLVKDDVVYNGTFTVSETNYITL